MFISSLRSHWCHTDRKAMIPCNSHSIFPFLAGAHLLVILCYLHLLSVIIDNARRVSISFPAAPQETNLAISISTWSHLGDLFWWFCFSDMPTCLGDLDPPSSVDQWRSAATVPQNEHSDLRRFPFQKFIHNRNSKTAPAFSIFLPWCLHQIEVLNSRWLRTNDAAPAPATDPVNGICLTTFGKLPTSTMRCSLTP